MAGYDGSIKFDTKIDSSKLPSQLNGVKSQLKASFASMRDVMMGPVEAGKLIGDVILKIGEKLGSMVAKAAEAERAQSTLKAVFTATGAAAWTSMGQLNDYADAMEASTLFDGKDITKMQSVLLGFKNITGEVFESASNQILNMSQVMGMDLTSSAQALGKALDDPINGIDSLSRQGFKFADADKAMLKGLIETGQMAKAQKYIIDQLGTTFGDAAQTATQNATGGFQAIRKEFEKISENLGKIIAIKASDFAGLVGLRDALKETNKELGTQAQYLETQKKFSAINSLSYNFPERLNTTEQGKKQEKEFEAAAQAMLPSKDEFNSYLGYMLDQRDRYAGNTKQYKKWDEEYYNTKLIWEKDVLAAEEKRVKLAKDNSTPPPNPLKDDLDKIIKKYKETVAGNDLSLKLGITTPKENVSANEEALKQEISALNDLYQSSQKSVFVFNALKDAANEYAKTVSFNNEKLRIDSSNKNFEEGNKAYAERIEKQRDAEVESAKLAGKSKDEQLAIFDKKNAKEIEILKAAGISTQSVELDNASKRLEIIKNADQKELELKKKASAAEIKRLEEDQKNNALVSSGFMPSQSYSTNETTGDTQATTDSGSGTELGQMISGSFDPVAAALQELLKDLMKIENVQKVANPISTAVDAMMAKVEPVITDVLQPLAGFIELVGESVGTMLTPALKALQAGVEVVAEGLIVIYNTRFLPLANVLISVFVAAENVARFCCYAIYNVVNYIFTSVYNVIGSALYKIYTVVSNIFWGIYDSVLVPIATKMTAGMASLVNGIISVINSAINSINSVLGTKFSTLGEVSGKSGLTAHGSDTKEWKDLPYDPKTYTPDNPEDYYLSAITSSDLSSYSDDLADVNKELAKNKSLFADASKAGDAYTAVLTKIKSAASSFYDSLKDMGTKIASTLIDALENGFDNDDFLYTMEEYIRSQVIQAVVYTDTMQTAIAQIGTQISQAIASGTLDSGTMASIKAELSSLLSTAQSSMDAVQEIFGYAVGSLNIHGNQIAQLHDGEAVLPKGINQEAQAAGIYIGPVSGMNGAAASGASSFVTYITIPIDTDVVASATLRQIDGKLKVSYGD